MRKMVSGTDNIDLNLLHSKISEGLSILFTLDVIEGSEIGIYDKVFFEEAERRTVGEFIEEYIKDNGDRHYLSSLMEMF